MEVTDNESRSDVCTEKVWRIGIILSGNIADETEFLRIVSGCDYLVCADGGTRHLRPYGILPDLLTGDLDSIDNDDKNWIEQAQIPVNQFSPEKNYTDSELAVDSAIKLLESELGEQNIARPANRLINLCILAATGDRPDHVLGNQLMAGKLAREQYDIMLSDGRSWFYLLQGPVTKYFETENYPIDSVVSVVSLSEQVKGITYKGLKYPLNNYDLVFGSQRGVSNTIADVGTEGFEIEISAGTLMVIITAAE